MLRSTVSKCLVAFVTLAAASCGGATAGDAAGSGATGATSSGGTGGASGSSGGEGGMPARCLLRAQPGNCEAYFPAYFHNPLTGICEPFAYGGCGGNDNRFDTLAECQATCRGGYPDMDACEFSSDCTLTSLNCCAPCPDSADARAFLGINQKRLRDYAITRPCDGIACGPCLPVEELSSNLQYFVSTCEAGQCTVVDVRESPLTECSDSSECTLRDGALCCEACDGGLLVAIRSSRLPDMMCGAPPACRGCAPSIPPSFAAECLDGRCAVTSIE